MRIQDAAGTRAAKAVAILQARMSSKRLPGKVMCSLLGKPMIERQLERLDQCRTLGRVIVATSELPADDPLASHLASLGVDVFRGALDDVLGRFIGAAAAFGVQGVVVRLTADCPLADPTVIDACVQRQADLGVDYVSNALKRTYPRGLDVEVFPLEVLRIAQREATEHHEREHVTPFIYRHPERFRLADIVQDRDESHLRWTVDTPADFAFVERVYEALYPTNAAFTSDDVKRLPFTHLEPG